MLLLVAYGEMLLTETVCNDAIPTIMPNNNPKDNVETEMLQIIVTNQSL